MGPENGRIVTISELQRELHLIKDFLTLVKLLKIINRFNPNIVHSHLSKAGTISRIAVFLCNLFRRNKIQTVHTFHGHVLDAYFGNIKTRIFRNIEWILGKVSDRIISISSTQRWELTKKYKVADSSKISIINLGFDLKPFTQADLFKGQLCQKIGVSNNTLLIGIVGRLVPIKNHKMFLEAAKYFLEFSNHQKVKFLLIGDGELRDSLELYSIEMGLKDHVIFYGWERNIPMIYADLDILALTSLNEGTPVSIIEAMAASVPVVTTGVGGIKDLLGRIEPDQPLGLGFKICERGILCPKDDAIAFASALKYMTDGGYLHNKHKLLKARDFVLENYSVNRLIHEIEGLYDQLMIDRASNRG
jgi:glycosyltransferase involved in cell wall biosynthesis